MKMKTQNKIVREEIKWLEKLFPELTPLQLTAIKFSLKSAYLSGLIDTLEKQIKKHGRLY